MQCKDIPEMPILEFLASIGTTCGGYPKPATWFGYIENGELPKNSVLRAMPDGTPEKLALAKMRTMIKKGLVDGCGCGCRGDFEITNKGKSQIHDR